MLTTSSKSPSRLSTDARALLEGLIARPLLHARFLNTLSLLEHIGCRKILLSHKPGALREDTLRHLAEEARHAHFFRRASERLARRPLDYGLEGTLAPWAARLYFERLDASVTRALGESRPLAYRYVTLAVELRAQWLYELYEEALRASKSTLSLRSVLAEENAHLRQMNAALEAADPRYASRRDAFADLESSLFSRWLEAMRTAGEVPVALL